MRQSTFADKICQLRWLGPDFLKNLDSGRVLRHCILHYYRSVGFTSAVAVLRV